MLREVMVKRCAHFRGLTPAVSGVLQGVGLFPSELPLRLLATDPSAGSPLLPPPLQWLPCARLLDCFLPPRRTPRCSPAAANGLAPLRAIADGPPPRRHLRGGGRYQPRQ